MSKFSSLNYIYYLWVRAILRETVLETLAITQTEIVFSNLSLKISAVSIRRLFSILMKFSAYIKH